MRKISFEIVNIIPPFSSLVILERNILGDWFFRILSNLKYQHISFHRSLYTGKKPLKRFNKTHTNFWYISINLHHMWLKIKLKISSYFNNAAIFASMLFKSKRETPRISPKKPPISPTRANIVVKTQTQPSAQFNWVWG